MVHEFSLHIGFLLPFMVFFLVSSPAAPLTGSMKYSTEENPSSSVQDLLIQSSGRSWLVPTGPRDGRVSLASETNPLPDLTHSIDDQIRMFSAMGLNAQDLVSLGGLRKLCIFEVKEVEEVDIEMPPRASPSGPHN